MAAAFRIPSVALEEVALTLPKKLSPAPVDVRFRVDAEKGMAAFGLVRVDAKSISDRFSTGSGGISLLMRGGAGSLAVGLGCLGCWRCAVYLCVLSRSRSNIVHPSTLKTGRSNDPETGTTASGASRCSSERSYSPKSPLSRSMSRLNRTSRKPCSGRSSAGGPIRPSHRCSQLLALLLPALHLLLHVFEHAPVHDQHHTHLNHPLIPANR